MSSHLSITKLFLTNFRNYEKLELQLPSKVIAITGKNGAGKTNILEAISLLIPGRGMRSAKLGELSLYDKKFSTDLQLNYNSSLSKLWSIFAEVNSLEGKVTIGTGLSPFKNIEKRIVKINGEIKRSQATLGHYFSICCLTPRMDHTFIDGATSRRAFLDRLTESFFPEHVKHLTIYSRAKSERHKVLFQARNDDTWLDAIEERMSEYGVAIAAARLETVEHLQKAMLDTSSAFPHASLSVDGEIEALLAEKTALMAEITFREKLQFSRQDDAETGRTRIGVHRSNFHVVYTEKNKPAEFSSTGEQKAMLISITLAAAKARQNWFGATPVLLMDEVVAHLDESRRGAFFTELHSLGGQIFLTATESSFFAELKGKATFLTVDNGEIFI